MSDIDMTPASVFNVAREILEVAGDMSTMKLQKLCFFAQGWTLAWTSGTPLFEEEFQAWKNGPVCYPLFRAHRGKYSVSKDDINEVGSPLQPWHESAIAAAIKPYLRITGVGLSELTHEAGTPWAKARGSLGPGEPTDVVIDKSLIKAYFAERVPVA